MSDTIVCVKMTLVQYTDNSHPGWILDSTGKIEVLLALRLLYSPVLGTHSTSLPGTSTHSLYLKGRLIPGRLSLTEKGEDTGVNRNV